VGNHNVRLAIKVHGRLSPDALTSALGALIQRHDALRTAFGASDEGQLTRRVAIEEVGAVVLEARRVAPAEVEELVLAEARRPFDLAVAPLMRVSLFELSSTEHLLLIVVHHIVFDGWSEGVLLRDLAALYEAEVGGRPAELPRLSLQYADYAAWHRGQLEASGDVEAVAYWRKVLEGLPALDLPGIGVAAVDSGRGGVERVAFGGRLTAEVRELAVAEGTTPFVVVLAALSVVLGRWACQPMFGIGVPFANRPAGAEDVVGLFVETLIVPVDMRDRPTFRQLVRRLRDHLLQGMRHPDVPLEDVFAELLERGRSTRAITAPLMIALDVPTDGSSRWSNELVVTRRELDVSLTKSALSARVLDSDPMACVIGYNTEILDRTTVNKLGNALHAALQDRETPISFDETAASEIDVHDQRPSGDQSCKVSVAEVRQIWQQLLGIEAIPPNAKFFEIGGNSLLLAELHVALRSRYAVPQLRLIDLLELATCEEIAQHLSRGMTETRST